MSVCEAAKMCERMSFQRQTRCVPHLVQKVSRSNLCLWNMSMKVCGEIIVENGQKEVENQIRWW